MICGDYINTGFYLQVLRKVLTGAQVVRNVDRIKRERRQIFYDRGFISFNVSLQHQGWSSYAEMLNFLIMLTMCNVFLSPVGVQQTCTTRNINP